MEDGGRDACTYLGKEHFTTRTRKGGRQKYTSCVQEPQETNVDEHWKSEKKW